MDRVLYWAAMMANVLLAGFAVFLIFFEIRGARDMALVLLLCLPPVLSVLALHYTADREERILLRKVRKARLRRELKDLEG